MEETMLALLGLYRKRGTMYLHMLSLAPEGPWCVFYAARCQV